MGELMIREPSEKETRVIDDLRSRMLGILRGRTRTPLNVCIYAAFPAHEWKIAEDGSGFLVEREPDKWDKTQDLEMNLWLTYDPEIGNLQEDPHIRNDVIGAIRERKLWLIHNPETGELLTDEQIWNDIVNIIKRPRSVLVTKHWEKCRLAWNNDLPSIVPSEQAADRQFNGRFEFDYQVNREGVVDILSECEQWLHQYGGYKEIGFYRSLNKLDDFIFTTNGRSFLDSICFARIPYLSVPLSAIFIPRLRESDLRHIQEDLYRTTRLQAVLSTYVHTALQRYADGFAHEISQRHWQLYPSIIIPTVLGLSISSVLLPRRVEIYQDIHNTKPSLTISLAETSLASLAGIPSRKLPFKRELNVAGVRGHRFRLVIEFLDHENPFLFNFEEVIRLWEETDRRVERISEWPESLYEQHTEMFNFALGPIVTGLEAYAELQISRALNKDIQSYVREMGLELGRRENDLKELSKAEGVYQIRLNQMRNVSKELAAGSDYSGGTLIDVLTRLGKIDSGNNDPAENHFDSFIATYGASEEGIKHALENIPQLSETFCNGLEQFVVASLEQFNARYGQYKSIVSSFKDIISSTAEVTLKGKKVNWPIFIQPGGIPLHETKSLIKQSLEAAMKDKNPGINVEVCRIDNNVWGCDLAILCFFCRALFNVRKPLGQAVSACYDSRAKVWVLSWEASESIGRPLLTDFGQRAKEVEESLQNLNKTYVANTLSARIWFLWKCFGSIYGGFKERKAEDTYRLEMIWSLEHP